jgi:hypothetical protein
LDEHVGARGEKKRNTNEGVESNSDAVKFFCEFVLLLFVEKK